MSYVLTKTGRALCNFYIRELKAKRKEILDAGLDTADDTNLPTLADIEADINWEDRSLKDGVEEYCNGWGVTDNHNADYPLLLLKGKDFVEAKRSTKYKSKGLIKPTMNEYKEWKENLYNTLCILATDRPEFCPRKRDSLATLLESFFYWADEYNDGYFSEMDNVNIDRYSAWLAEEKAYF